MQTTTTTLDRLSPDPENLRKHFDEEADKELEQSIGGPLGLLEPLIVRPNGTPDNFVIVAGERRFRALTSLIRKKKLPKDHPIPIVVREGMTPAEITEAMLIENLQRQDLTPVDEALGYLRLTGFGMTQAKIAEAIGRSPAYIKSRLRLASLPQVALDAVTSGEVDLRHADELVTLVEIAGPDALDDEAVLTNEYRATQAITAARREALTDTIAKQIPEGVEFGEIPYEDREAMKRLGHADPTGDDALVVPKGSTHAMVSYDYRDQPTLTFWRAMTPAEQKKAGLVDGKRPKVSDTEKDRRARQRAENIRTAEFVATVTIKPKASDVHAFVPGLIRSLVNRADTAKEICPILEIEPDIIEVTTYGDKTQKRKDWESPLLRFYDASEANARRVAMAFFGTDYRTRGAVYEAYGFKPKDIR